METITTGFWTKTYPNAQCGHSHLKLSLRRAQTGLLWWGWIPPPSTDRWTEKVHNLHRYQPSLSNQQASFSSFFSLLVVRFDVGLGLDFTVHASVYGKVPSLPRGWSLLLLMLSSTTRPLHAIS